MEVLNEILIWIHIASLGLGGAAVFGLPVVRSKMAAATPETRQQLFSIANGLSTLGRAGLGLLIVTGPLLYWLKFNGAAPNVWFTVKLVLVAILIGVVIYAGINGKRAQAGDMAAAQRAPAIGIASMVLYLAVIATAVAAFD